MIPRWNVIESVAARYGHHKKDFETDKDKLELARQGKMAITELESNNERMEMRMARNDSLAPFVLERINGIPNFQDAFVLESLLELSHSVVRISKRGSPLGTGFLVGEDVIITNHHVIGSPAEADDMLAEFDFELDRHMVPKKSSAFKINASRFFLTSSLEYNSAVPNSGLDFTLVGLDPIGTSGEQLIQRFKPNYLDGNPGKIVKGESCVIIQHPSGLPKKVVMKDTAFFSETGTRLVYESDTLPGSSGSMVVGLGTGSIIALHHAGLPRTNDQNMILTTSGQPANAETRDEDIDWIGNEGIKISCIVVAIKDASLPSSMESRRRNLLNRSESIEQTLNAIVNAPSQTIVVPQSITPNNSTPNNAIKPMDIPNTFSRLADFLITAVNKEEVIDRISSVLKVRYGGDVKISLAMPASAIIGKIELFSIQARFDGDLNREAQELCQVPGIINAEADVPLALNTGTSVISQTNLPGLTESIFDSQPFGKPNEDDFLKEYARKHQSPYLKDNVADYPANRKWNWAATKFDQVIANPNVTSPSSSGIRIVQFDTGFTNHPKVEGGYDFDHDFNFLNDTNSADDSLDTGLLRQPGHGTRTASLLIGNNITTIKDNGNEGLLREFDYKLVPFRIASSVILINRQKELAAALDAAIQQGFDIITMSMGLPPTIATAKMAKKAYDSGVIWCCAAGNEIQAVIAPAVYPGTIAVAASNPLDRDWSGSSRGNSVDITAPGQAVYVPILISEHEYGFAYGDGTSYATPHVSAAAALWLAKYKDILNHPDFAGWKRVEAFRKALRDSARKQNQLPRNGFGAGMLNVQDLLAQAPSKDLTNAYDGWNENAFFAFLQGTGEIAKTYWNRIHGWIFGTKKGGQESLIQESMPLSQMGAQIEKAMFSTRLGQLESASVSQEDLLERFNFLHDKMMSSSKK
jgi:endonuclease G